MQTVPGNGPDMPMGFTHLSMQGALLGGCGIQSTAFYKTDQEILFPFCPVVIQKLKNSDQFSKRLFLPARLITNIPESKTRERFNYS